MSIMMKAFTSRDDDEIRNCLTMLLNTDAEQASFMNLSTLMIRAFHTPVVRMQNTLFATYLSFIADGKVGLLDSL